LHSRPETAEAKILAAYQAGCRRFDSALTGLGGCPFAGDNLVGNIATEDVLSTVQKLGVVTGIEPLALASVLKLTHELRAKYAHSPLPS
jgi:hydroxymethylglutaryl-CoA lyase